MVSDLFEVASKVVSIWRFNVTKEELEKFAEIKKYLAKKSLPTRKNFPLDLEE